MPAIQLARLRLKSATLAQSFGQPETFVQGIKSLLEFYADRTHRPGRSGEPQPLIVAYNVPAPILNQIFLDLKPLVNEQPEESLALSRALWQEPYLECRILSARLLGQISPVMTSEVLACLKQWLPDTREERLIDILVDQGLSRLRLESLEVVLDQITTWLEDDNPLFQRFGLRAMVPILNDPNYENLPLFFRLLTPFLRHPPPALRPDVLSVLSGLIRKSPQEVAYVLRQNLGVAENPDTAWLIRQVIKEFPPEQQSSLRLALKEEKWSV